MESGFWDARPATQRKRTAFQAALLLYLVLLLVALPFAWAARSVLSGRHGYSALPFRVWKWIARPGRPVSSYRHTVPLLRETWVDSEQGDAERVLLVGTSQTWGSGASRFDGDLAHRLASRLTASLAPRTFEGITGGISARRADFLRDLPFTWGAEPKIPPARFARWVDFLRGLPFRGSAEHNFPPARFARRSWRPRIDISHLNY